MIKPLSCRNYYLNNKRKVIPVVVSISIGVFLLYFMYIIGDSVINTAEAGLPDTLSYFSLLYPQEDTGINSSVQEEIKRNDNVKKVIEVKYGQTNIRFMGSQTFTMVLFMAKKDFKELFDKMELRLKEGSLPQGEDELILHWKVAANKGLKPGQYIGKEVNDNEPLNGKYKISGIYDGDSQLFFGIAGSSAEGRYDVLMVQPKPGKLDEMNSFLKNLPYKKMGMSTLDIAEQEFSNNMQIVYIGSFFIEFLVILVLCITIGNTTYLHFLQRKREFGILLAVGYKKRDILKRILLELANMVFTALAAGVLLAILTGFILKTVYMDPTGFTVNLLSLKYLLVTAILPVFILIFTLLPALRLVKSTDKINVIEGN